MFQDSIATAVCISVCCSGAVCVTVCCSERSVVQCVLQCVAVVQCSALFYKAPSLLQARAAELQFVLQWVAMCCSGVVCRRVLQGSLLIADTLS